MVATVPRDRRLVYGGEASSIPRIIARRKAADQRKAKDEVRHARLYPRTKVEPIGGIGPMIGVY